MLRTACHDWHAAHNGRMVDFAGWHMPVQYSSIVAEHLAVRNSAGVFDIAHMGRLEFTGPDAAQILDFLVTNNVGDMEPGRVRYALVCNEAGGVLDDVLVYRLPERHLLVVNASNRLKILDWIEGHIAGYDARFNDLTFSHFMLAVQGPRAMELLQPLAGFNVGEINYYWTVEGDVLNVPAVVSRTGYTGEDGFEVILPAEHGPQLWEALLDRGRDAGLLPAGLGCRDTLRLEAAMPLYGHELTEQIDPLTAGLSFAVKLNDAEFVGRDRLRAIKAEGGLRKRVGLELEGRRIAREGCPVFADGKQVGQVTSGTFSPTLEKSIAMAYVEPQHAAAASTLEIDIRGKRAAAAVVELPFYRRPS